MDRCPRTGVRGIMISPERAARHDADCGQRPTNITMIANSPEKMKKIIKSPRVRRRGEQPLYKKNISSLYVKCLPHRCTGPARALATRRGHLKRIKYPVGKYLLTHCCWYKGFKDRIPRVERKQGSTTTFWSRSGFSAHSPTLEFAKRFTNSDLAPHRTQ